MPHIVVIAYGNPTRSDDGIAWHAAAALEGKFSTSDVEIVCTHQLAPELAETISRCAAAIFVDAAGNGSPGEIRARQIGLPQGPVRFWHQLSPDTVVALARNLFGVEPHAFSVTLAGACFDHGESLSPAAAAALPALVARVAALIQQFLPAEASRD
ncbi:MAG TPA: hydrogenase maturation protease [Candidatus Sulfotelmatobacter sp.]|jgi:hydrogenase maturation protease|nr:hydrogenase maturation protease [Candidatus Sulfotelmatobacter sp.]